MDNILELTNLFEEKLWAGAPTDNIPPIASCFSPIHVDSRELEELLNFEIPSLFQATISLEKAKEKSCRVDGVIIGTGEADFTKGNTFYTLNYKGKTFQLIDVPGIEGDESKYAHMVREAVAKAHLVFYVNGTNKKPEKNTAEKIRSYLRHGTQVCPIVNVRGNADAYEFEEDRVSLKSHGGAVTALMQTMEVLESVLGKDVLYPGQFVQGLLAFSSLAINPKNRQTSIHPSRDKDLVIQQSNYLKHFTSVNEMFDFSQIRAISQVLHEKQGTFREDIIESNKVKVRELLNENIGILKKTREEHQTFIDRVDPEFEKCCKSISGAMASFERLIFAGSENIWKQFFNSLTEAADKIVAEHFGDNDVIKTKLEENSKLFQDFLEKRLQEQFDEHLKTLQDRISQAMERLIQDVQRVEYQQQCSLNPGKLGGVYHPTILAMGWSWKDWGSISWNIGSLAALGAKIGSGINPGIGTAIGAAIGVILGTLVSIIKLLTSKEKRIRKAQAQVQEIIDRERGKVIGGLPSEIKKLTEDVRREVEKPILGQVDDIYASLKCPLHIIQKQIALMTNIINQLERMPYGTIQAIRR